MKINSEIRPNLSLVNKLENDELCNSNYYVNEK